jgi:predicted P-loop ATPase
MKPKYNKTEIIKSALDASFDIFFDVETGKPKFKKKDDRDFEDITSDVVEMFHADLQDREILVTKTDVRRALNLTYYDKQKDIGQHEEIEMLLDTYLESRFNIIKQKPEFCIHNQMDEFIALDKFSVNSINRYIRSKGLKTSKEALTDILFSNYSALHNPIKDYFDTLPPYSEIEGDYILELANTIDVKNPTKWYEYLKKWLVAVVANAMIDDSCKNHTMLVLTGEQGTFKTTWLDNLCPDKLKLYLYTGKIDPNNKDTQTLLAEFFLVNVDDQLKQLNKKDENDLKNMITAPKVKYRRPYDVFIQEYPHVCSFMGSVNGSDYLNDPTGSRRFLSFEVVQIHIKKAQAMNMDLVWKQANQLFKNGFNYWFNSAEIEELHEQNKAFQVVSLEEELLLKFYEKPEHIDRATHHLNTAEILSYIQSLANVRLRYKTLNDVLKKLGFTHDRRSVSNSQKRGWFVITLSEEQRFERSIISSPETTYDAVFSGSDRVDVFG